jgi:glycosyltransferase A (GT-A) superfamily protein (DUF2064 family)
MPGPPITAVLMAKRPAPGRVKTRLIEPGRIDAETAAALASAMIACVATRLAARWPLVVAVDPDLERSGWPDDAAATLFDAGAVTLVEQGDGDLGARIDRVWRHVGVDRRIAFFGGDSPDVPDAALAAIAQALDGADVAVGPTSDGGYWTLAAAGYHPAVVQRIDWGGRSVYDQTCLQAERAGIALRSLPPWFDVDRPDDVQALRTRLARPDGNAEPALGRLARRLDTLLDGSGSLR